MNHNENILLVLSLFTVIIVLIIYILFKKRLSYISAHGILMHYRKLNFIIFFANFLPTLFLSVYTVKMLSDNVELIKNSFDKYEPLLFITKIVFVILYFILIGIVLEYFFYHTNDEFKKWKDENILKK